MKCKKCGHEAVLDKPAQVGRYHSFPAGTPVGKMVEKGQRQYEERHAAQNEDDDD